jgi:hypothetical protein
MGQDEHWIIVLESKVLEISQERRDYEGRPGG